MRSAAGRRPRHVEKEVVQQLDRRRSRIGLLALRVQPLQLAIGMAEQALDGDARLESAFPQRIDETTGHPPELVERRGSRDRFHAVRDVSECGEPRGPAPSPRMRPRSPAWNRGRRRRAHCATVSFVSEPVASRAAGDFSELRFSEQQRALGQERERRARARRSLRSGNSTSARSRPPPSTRSR